MGPFIRLFWIKRIDGLENIPREGPIILAPNHSSYLDFFSLATICPRRIHFVAAEVFFNSKLWLPLMVLTRQTKIDRKSKDKSETLRQINKILKSGKVFCIFPEGTRSRTGKIQKSYSGVFRIAKENKVDIVPVAINGAYEVLPPNKKIPKLRKKIQICFLEKMEYKYFDQKDNEDSLGFLMTKIANKIGQRYKW